VKYIKLFENFEDYDPYELMITPPNKNSDKLITEIKRENPNLNLVNDLISIGVDLEWQDKYGWTLLHYCVRWNRPEIARMLIDAGVNVNNQDKYNETALQLCALDNRPEIARMLIDAGADVNMQAENGWTALYYCAIYNNLEIARMLIDAGADKTITSNREKLPYETAMSQELKELLKP
jgi:ankyrin repeat protein